MAYLELFERVAKHIGQFGIDVTFARGEQLSSSSVKHALSKSLIQIPNAMAEFYAEVGDGMAFYWETQEPEWIVCNHEFPKLKSCVVESLDKLSWKIEWDDAYDYRFTKNPALAKQTALSMRKWMPFNDEGNGDEFCLDTACDPAPVVFNQHDWFDGGTGANGHRLADSLLEFYTDWAKVCFQCPRDLWWPAVLNKNGDGVDWSSDQFLDRYRLP